METAKILPSKLCTSPTGRNWSASQMCAPDHDPHDFGNDSRFQRMMDDVFDIARTYHVSTNEVLVTLEAAVEEGDQR